MGCDIHIVAELHKDGKWELIPRGLFPPDEYDRRMLGLTARDWPFDWRYYPLYSLLAGVRDRGLGIIPIAEPRGLPADICDEARKLVDHDDWAGQGHSASWLSVKDLMDYPHYEREAGMWQQYGPDERPLDERPVTVQERLGPQFFDDVEILMGLHEDPASVRVVFFFDS